jgi:hypothetical protein
VSNQRYLPIAGTLRLIASVASDFNEKLFSFDNNDLHGFLSTGVLTASIG